MYQLIKKNSKTNKEEVLKIFANENEVLEFAKLTDVRLSRIHEKQRSMHNATAKKVFFNVYAENFFKADKKVINWFSIYCDKKNWNWNNYSIKAI